MRIRFKPTAAQRAALRAQLVALGEPERLMGVLRPSLPGHCIAQDVTSRVMSLHPDRFVLRVQVHSRDGEELAYALKGYSDDFGARVWTHASGVATHQRLERDGLALPTAYLPDERLLVFPLVQGIPLSDVADECQPALLRRAARLAAELHRLPLVPEEATSPQAVVAEARCRCDRMRKRWPATARLVEPLMTAVEQAAKCLDPTHPAPVHGDMATGQFLWTGERLVLLDLDMFGYTDPAYDAGHFLAQLERRCMRDRVDPPRAAQWLATFRDAYLEAMPPPRVSARNVSFYHGVTLLRKIYTLHRKRPPEWERLVPCMAERARTALAEALPAVQRR